MQCLAQGHTAKTKKEQTYAKGIVSVCCKLLPQAIWIIRKTWGSANLMQFEMSGVCFCLQGLAGRKCSMHSGLIIVCSRKCHPSLLFAISGPQNAQGSHFQPPVVLCCTVDYCFFPPFFFFSIFLE